MLILIFIILTSTQAFQDLSYQTIVNRFKELQQNYSDIMILKNNFDSDEGLPEVNCGLNECEFFYAQITENNTIKNKPAVLLVGGFHGDERVGADVITELAQLIVQNRNMSPIKEYLQDRVILLMPMVNPNGVFMNKREEQQKSRSVDVNRDFNYDSDGSCFQSKGGRALANIYKEYVIFSGVTFHGGDNCISYPWGSMNHLNDDGKATTPPDILPLQSFSEIMQSISLGNNLYNIQKYKIGTMTDLVYPLNGAYEDWAYAGGWETSFINNKCSNVNQTFYSELNGSPRALIYLIEADYMKKPPDATFGSIEALKDLLQSWPPVTFTLGQQAIDRSQNLTHTYGHIPRNILLSLSIIDVTQPYLIDTPQGFKVGGCFNVSKLTIEDSTGRIISQFNNKPGIWNKEDRGESFIFNTPKYLSPNKTNPIYVSLSCDDKFKDSIHGDPNVVPQSYLIQSRMYRDFEAKVGEHIVYSRLAHKFVYDDGFKYLLTDHKKNDNTKIIPDDISNPNRQDNQYIYHILLVMMMMAMILSYIFFKLCGGENKQNGIEMVVVQRLENDIV